MILPSYAGYVIVPLHLVAGALFALVPPSPYKAGYYATYGAIVTLLAVTLGLYIWLLWTSRPGYGTVWLQFLLATLSAAGLFFLLEFNSPWHAIVYPLMLGASLLLCLVIGHLVLFILRP